MMTEEPSPAIDLAREADFQLGGLTVSPSACSTRGPAGERRVERKVMEVLLALTRRIGATVSRDQLIDACWGGRIVSDDAVNRAIAQVRNLARGFDPPPFVLETIPKVGFRLIPSDGPAAPSVPRTEAATNLPSLTGSLIGRLEDADAVERLLAAARLVTIVGGGGVGKTRLGAEVARRQLGLHEDGVWLSELAATADPQRVPELVAKAMHVDLPVGKDAGAILVERLRRRRCLLVIDNCEHLIDAVAALVDAILAHAPEVKLLLTSREAIGVLGEQVFRLAPLSPSPAEALLVERILAGDPDFRPGPDNAVAVAAICQRLDGLPLAIEMAAARVPVLGCEGVLQRLDDRFRVLTGGRRTAMARQRTLAATLDWSYDLLSEREAAVFRRLGVFVGGFSIEAAAEVAGSDATDGFEMLETISGLVAKSLVTARTTRRTIRYAFLETTRAYALDKLADAGEADATRRRHAQWCARSSAPMWADFISRIDDDALLSRYLPDFDNVHLALDWAYGPDGDVETGHRLLAATACLWDDRPLKRRLDVALPLVTAGTPPAIRARLLASRAHVVMRLNPNAALDILDEAVEAVAAHVDDPVALCDVLASKGAALWFMGRFTEAVPIADRMLRLVDDLPFSRIKAFAMALDASLKAIQEGPHAAAPLFQEAVASLRAFGADGLANYWQWRGLRLAGPADPDQAIELWRALLARIRPGDMYAEAVGVSVSAGLAERLARRGTPADLEEALAVARVALKGGARQPDPRVLLSLALVAAKAGRLEDAAVIIGYVDTRLRDAAERSDRAAIDAVRRLIADGVEGHRLAILGETGASLGGGEVLGLALGEAGTPRGSILQPT